MWLEPNRVIRYVEYIRDGLSQADPDGAAIYQSNANDYIEQLQELDRWIEEQGSQIPTEENCL
jgi:ABC-type Zn uptake system ZnuABC Zn-binding protein ZnuA